MRISATADEPSDGSSLEEQVERLEKKHLMRAMKEAGGNKSAAARILGISERKIRYMLKKYGGEE